MDSTVNKKEMSNNDQVCDGNMCDPKEKDFCEDDGDEIESEDEEEESSVFYPETAEEYTLVKEQTKDKLVVINFSATWCGPCKKIAPRFEQLASENPTQVFMKVDVDDEAFSSLQEVNNTSSVPTYRFYKNNVLLDEFSGANFDKLVTLFNKHK